jgi:nicotinamidase-related amidase
MKNIIIVDMQEGFMNANNIHLIKKINSYIKNNRFNYAYYTKFENKINSPFQTILNWHAMKTSEEQKIVVDILENAQIISKSTYSLPNKTIKHLKQNGISEIELCGTDTEACVLAIAYQLFDNGIKPILLKELCGTSSDNTNLHKAALDIIKRSFNQ